MTNVHKVHETDQVVNRPNIDESKYVIWRMIRSSANDNFLPIANWFAWLIFWTIMVGGLLAYVFL
jgi:hypothetical protein